MIGVDVTQEDIVVTLSAWDRVFTLRRRVRVPLSAIVAVRPAPEMIESRPVGFRLPGSLVPFWPGPLFAGTYRERGGARTFWALRRASAQQILRIDLADKPASGPYRMLVLQVDDPIAVAERIDQAISAYSTNRQSS